MKTSCLKIRSTNVPLPLYIYCCIHHPFVVYALDNHFLAYFNLFVANTLIVILGCCSGGQWNSGGQCDHETEPIKNETYLTEYPSKMVVLEKVLKGMKKNRVTYLNITRMTDYRKDGHPSIYRKLHMSEEDKIKPLQIQDCSHWCLPGVPDAWNEILYAELLVKLSQKRS